MSQKDKKQSGGAGNAAASDKAPAGGQESGAKPSEPQVTASGWSDSGPAPRQRDFAGPRNVREPLRISMSRDAYADLTAHAKESLDAEVCGVLVGDLCEDDAGLHVQVEGAIRGSSARKGSTHVTFTQDTWNQIHADRDRSYPKRRIVGWYHTHPGFGVEFSEMDLFIHRNFFAGPAQLAFVADPLGGDEAIVVNSGSGTAPVSRFWVDGRERRCWMPPEQGAEGGAAPAALDKALKEIETRLNQVVQGLESTQAVFYRFLLTVGMLVALGVAFVIGYWVYSNYQNKLQPPQLRSFAPVPVQIGDKTVMLGVGVASWEVPRELNAAFLELEREKQKAAEEQKKKELEAARKQPKPPASAEAK